MNFKELYIGEVQIKSGAPVLRSSYLVSEVMDFDKFVSKIHSVFAFSEHCTMRLESARHLFASLK